jgi:tetratricopeptide (TPR) repeat protein
MEQISSERIKASMAGSRNKLKSVALAEPILVGREQELEELKRYFKLAIEGKGTTIFVSGEAGSGKTRLTAEFLDIAKKEEVMILAGWCLSNAAQPYFPFVEAFESYYSTVDSGLVQQQELKTWFSGPNQAEKHEITPQLWKDRTFAAITKELLYMSTNGPVILFIDDIHWADSASLALLHYIARTITSERLLIIATFRTEEISAKLDGLTHPLAEVLRLMAREELFKEIKLQNLSQANVGRIAEDMLKGSLDSEFAERLSEESHGNPLFVVEALRMMYSQGGLLQEHGRWHIRNENIEIPTKVKDLIMRRLDALKPNERRILDAASVLGEKFDPKLVAAVLSQDNLEVLEALNAAAQNTLLVFCKGSHYYFNHTKIREMLYEEIPPILKGEYHSRIAEKIEAANQGLNGSAASVLAYHYSMAGNKEKATESALAAGKEELAKWSNTQAIKHFTYALEALGEDPEHAEQRERALNGLGDAFYADGLYKDAERTFEELASISQKNSVKLRALRMAMYSAFTLGDTSHLAELLKKAEPYSASDRLENARVLRLKGSVFTLQHNLPASIKCNETALHVFEEEYSLADAALCLLSLGSQRVVTGKLEGLADSLFAVALFGELGAFSQQMIACYLAGDSFSNCLLLPEALSMYAKIVEIYEKTKVGNYSALAFGYAFSSRIFECLGDLEKALTYSLKALEVSNKTDALVAHGVIFCNLVIQYARLGNLKRAEEYSQKLVKLPPEIRSHYFVRELVAKAALLASKNQWKESNKYFTEFLEQLESSPGSYWDKFYTRQLYAWSLERQERYEEARVQLEESRKIRQETEERFEHVNVQANLMAPICIGVNQPFNMRLDIVNVSRKQNDIVRIENVIPTEFEVLNSSPENSMRNAVIELQGNSVKPFSVKSIKLTLQTAMEGTFRLRPRIRYINDLGNKRTTFSKAIFINVKTPINEEKGKPVAVEGDKIEFESEAAQRAFDYLLKAFVEDYARRKFPQEKSGWRTLMDLVREGHVSQYSAYGTNRRQGLVPSELKHSGLIEVRVFVGERGRGGKILKLRITCAKEIVKKRISTLI